LQILTGETEVLGEKHYTVWVVDGWMSMEQWWNGTDREKLKYWGKNIIQLLLWINYDYSFVVFFYLLSAHTPIFTVGNCAISSLSLPLL
jgi:hypothetical protein